MQPIRDRRSNKKSYAVILFSFGLCCQSPAQTLGVLPSQTVAQTGTPQTYAVTSRAPLPSVANAVPAMAQFTPLIVIGFMGGNVHASNLVHREAQLARNLQQLYPQGLHAAVFANSDWKSALSTVLHHLAADGRGNPNADEKNSARIVIYGHSWGASETVTLARRLNQLGIPVLLTVQVDSVEKMNQNDATIPPNVREAVNFYQTEGLLHGRSLIAAMDPARTKILGNFQSSYRDHPVSCPGYPWFARAFMKPHIEIENDPSVWNRVEALIRTKLPQ